MKTDKRNDLQQAISNLLNAYKENINTDISGDLSKLKQDFAEINIINDVPLLLRFNQSEFRLNVFELIFPNNGKPRDFGVTFEYVEHVLSSFCVDVLQNAKSMERDFNSFYNNVVNPSRKKYLVGYPITINLQRSENTKIIDLVLTNNPDNYIKSEIPESNTDFINIFEKYPDNQGIEAGIFSEIEAIDQSDADQKFKQLCDESIGFIKLFYRNNDAYIGKQKDDVEHRVIFPKQDNKQFQIGGTWLTRLDNPLIVFINDKKYEYLLQHGLKWLNNWKTHTCILKGKKTKTALYWFKHACDERNITNKFIYAITVLETILKQDGETAELTTSISERVAYLLYNDKKQRIYTFEKFKKIYSLRSKIVHTGAVLSMLDEYYVSQTIEYVRYVLVNAIKILSDESYSFKQFIEKLKYDKF